MQLIHGPIRLFISACCIVVSSLAVSVYSKSIHEIVLLLFLISGFLVTCLTLISLTIRLTIKAPTTRIDFVDLLILIPGYVFHIVVGIILIVNLSQSKITFQNTTPKHCEVIIPTIFIIAVIFMGISAFLSVTSLLTSLSCDDFAQDQQSSLADDSKDLYDLESQLKQPSPPNLPQNIDDEATPVDQYFLPATKQLSHQTLSNNHLALSGNNNNHNSRSPGSALSNDELIHLEQLSKRARLDNISNYTNNKPSDHDHSNEESNVLEYFIKSSMDLQNDANLEEYYDYNKKNWMDSSTKLHSLSDYKKTESGNESSPELEASARPRKSTFFGPSKLSSESFKRPRLKDLMQENNNSSGNSSNGGSPLKYSKSSPALWRSSSISGPRSPGSSSRFNDFKDKFKEKNPGLFSSSTSNLSSIISPTSTHFNHKYTNYSSPNLNVGAQSESINNHRFSKLNLASNSKMSLSTIFTENSNNMKASKSDNTILNSRRVSLINSNCESDNNIYGMQLNNLDEESPAREFPDDASTGTVKRAKSTSYINNNKETTSSKRLKRKEQRWKSINDEKIFLSNVNESLLPSVLKSGESPILEIKRQQQEVLEREQQQQQQQLQLQEQYQLQLQFQQQQQQQQLQIENLGTENKPVNQPSYSPDMNEFTFHDHIKKPPVVIFNDTPPREQPKKFPYLSPVGENDGIEFNSPEKTFESATNPENDEEDENDRSSSLNLPHCGEFGETVNDEVFYGFDQETAYVPSEEESRKLNKVEEEPCHDNKFQVSELADKENSHEDYVNSLNGLEKIPTSKSTWLPKANSATYRSSSMNLISLQDWNENLETWNDQRNRSGANYGTPGITRIVSDHKLRNVYAAGERDSLLLPPVESRIDNIDNISDINSGNDGSTRRPSYSASNRSFSAPSLQTFRNVSTKSYATKASRPELEDGKIELLPVCNHSHKDSVFCNHSHKDSGFCNHSHKDSILSSSENTLRHCVTPTENITTSNNTSPIRKLFHLESPKRLSSVFQKKKSNRMSADLNILNKFSAPNGHKHTNSAASNQYSVSSAWSSKSSSPKKSFKSFINKNHHRKSHSSGTSFSLPAKPPLANFHKNAPQFQRNSNLDSFDHIDRLHDPIDFWDLETAPSSDRSRISSVPSAVIGEYDREKWRTLKALQSQEKLTFDTSV